MLLLGYSVFAQEANDPIDVAMNKCLSGPSGSSTMGQLECAKRAYESWDKELNAVYQRLMKSLDPTSRELLKASQKCWLAFREAETKFQSGPWLQHQGSLGRVTVSLVDVDILRSRVLTLRNYAGGGSPN